METLILILLSILPAIALLWYFEKQDKGRKEPKKLKWKIFRWGIAATLIATIIELNLEDIWRYFHFTKEENFWVYISLTAFITTAFTEEALKLWVVKKHVFRSKHFDEMMDGITYAIIASLGFAMLENIFYVLEGGLGVGIMRSLISVPAHALFSGIMGYYIGRAHFAKTPWDARGKLWKGFLIGMSYHGTMNFFLFAGGYLGLMVIPLLILLWIHLNNKIQKARYIDKVKGQKLPQEFTWKVTLKTGIGILLCFGGIGGIIGGTMMLKNPMLPITTTQTALGYIGLAALTYAGWYIIMPPKNSS